MGYDHAFQESAESLNVTDVWNWGDFLEPVILKVVIICNFLTFSKFNLASFFVKNRFVYINFAIASTPKIWRGGGGGKIQNYSFSLITR